MLQKFPNTCRWLQWWLQPSIFSMIFLCKTVMKQDLKGHSSQTTNAIESYHSFLYNLIPKKQPVFAALSSILQVAKSYQFALENHFDQQVRPTYSSSKKTKK